VCRNDHAWAHLREVGGGREVHVALAEVDSPLPVQPKNVRDESDEGCDGAEDDVVHDTLKKRGGLLGYIKNSNTGMRRQTSKLLLLSITGLKWDA